MYFITLEIILSKVSANLVYPIVRFRIVRKFLEYVKINSVYLKFLVTIYVVRQYFVKSIFKNIFKIYSKLEICKVPHLFSKITIVYDS